MIQGSDAQANPIDLVSSTNRGEGRGPRAQAKGTVALVDADWEEVMVADVCINRAVDGDAGILREFSSDIMVFDEAEEDMVRIGSVSGWIGWDLSPYEVWDGADAISSEAEQLGAVAAQLSRQMLSEVLANVLLVNEVFLAPNARGHRITGRVIDGLAELLKLDRTRTLVVLDPEPPQDPDDTEREGRDRIRKRIESALTKSGFQPWLDGPTWWRLLLPDS